MSLDITLDLPFADFRLQVDLHLPGRGITALFGPSGDKEWGPWGVPCRIVASQTHSCRPCGLDGCGGSKVSDCLTGLPVDQVHRAVQEMLSE